MRLRVARLDRDRALKQRLRLLVLPPANPVDEAERADNEPPGVDAFGRLTGRPKTLFPVEMRLDGSYDVFGDFILDREDVAQLAVVSFCPDVLTGRGINELPRHADPATGSSYA